MPSRTSQPSFLNPPTERGYASPSSFISADAPTVECQSQLLYSDASENMFLRTNLDFYSVSTHVNNSKFNWYRNDDILPDIRVRVIMCFNPLYFTILDFLSQRFNEYQAQNDSKEIASQLYNQLYELAEATIMSPKPEEAYLIPDSMNNLLSSHGPFDTWSFTRKMKNSPSSHYFYEKSDRGFLDGIVVYDVPVASLLRYDADGKPLTRANKSLPSSLGFVENSENYRFETIPSIGFTTDFSQGNNSEIYNLQNLSVYSFCYFDYQSFLDRKADDDIRVSATGINGSLLYNGCGFIDRKSPSGTKTLYSKQVGASLNSSAVLSSIRSPDKNKFIDARVAANINPEALRSKLYDTFYSSMVSSGVDKRTLQVIKDKNYFSNVWMSKDGQENTRLAFAFDRASFLYHKSNYPFLYISPGTKRELLKGGNFLTEDEVSKVINSTLKKRAVNPDSFVSQNSLQTSIRSGKYSRGDMQDEKNIGTVNELRGVYMPGQAQDIVLYQAVSRNTDEKKTQSTKRCQFGVEFYVKDASVLFLTRVLRALERSEKRVRQVYTSIIHSKDGTYDYNTGEMLVGISNIEVDNTSAFEVLSTEISFYLSLLDNFGVINSLTVDLLTENLIARVSQKDPNGIRFLADSISTFISQLRPLIISPPPSRTETSVSHSVLETSRSAKSTMLHLEHYFNDFEDYGENYGTGYSFLFDPTERNAKAYLGLNIFTKQSLLNRAQTEFSKYFDLQDSSQKADFLAQGFADSSLTYFSPLTISIWGKDAIRQDSYKKTDQNSLEFDFGRYASLFIDLVKLKNRKDRREPYAQMQSSQELAFDDVKIFNEARLALGDLSCTIDTEIEDKFSPMEPRNINDKATTLQAQGLEHRVKLSAEEAALFKGVFGATGTKQNADAETFLKNQDQQILDKEFTNEIKPDEQDEKRKVQKENPIKLMFNIVGEMTINSDGNFLENNYSDITFNSLTALSSMIGADPNNINNIITNYYRHLPNQTKAMIIMSAIKEQLVFGNGFDAVRPILKDKVEITGEEFVSAIFNDNEFPPYEVSGDPMRVYAKFLAFWMNYKNLAVVEYLDGFESARGNSATRYYLQTRGDNPFYTKVKMPKWKKFTNQFYQTNLDKTFLCRVRMIAAEDYNRQDIPENIFADQKEALELPIYNEYFLLEGR